MLGEKRAAMTDLPQGSSGVTTHLAASSAKPVSSDLDLENLVPGALWRGSYEVKETLPDITYGKLLSAKDTRTGENVVIRSFRVNDDLRARAWSQLSEYKGPGVVPLVEALEREGRRIEVTRLSSAKNLSEWAAGKPVSIEEVTAILRQLASIVVGLHRQSVAHLNLKPETVLVDTTAGKSLRVSVTGFEAAMDFSRAGLMSISVDPFYAPPEAVGLLQHHCGPALRAWDWWSVGRIVQQLLLGRHVLGVVLDRDVTRKTPELLMRADKLLREKEKGAPRAGGVEIMSVPDPRMTTLLRGLLASCRDARWGGEETEAWLRGESVKERYDLPTHQRLFRWQDRAYTPPEIAVVFSDAANWDEGVASIFGGKESASLVAFLAEDSALRDLSQVVTELTRICDTSAFSNLDPAAVRDVVAAIALAMIAGGKLRIRGCAVDTAFVTSMLAPSAQPMGLSVVLVLTERAAIQWISKVDPDAARMLTEFDRVASAAVGIAAQHHWMSRADRGDWARMLRLSLQGSDVLRQKLETLRQAYAASRNEELDTLFKKDDLSPSDLVVLAFVGENPTKYGFVAHDVWIAENHKILLEKGERLAAAGTWVNLARALRAGPHVVGPLPLVFFCWLAVSVPIAVAFPCRGTLAAAIALIVIGCVARTFLRILVRRELKERLPGANMPASASKCDAEACQLMRSPEAPSQRELAKLLAEVNAQIDRLAPKLSLARVRSPSRFQLVRSTALASGAVALSATVALSLDIAKHPPTVPLILGAWLHPTDQATIDAQKAAAAKKAAEQAAAERKSRHKDRAVDEKIAWSFRPPPNPQGVRVIKVMEPTPEQNREAREAGEYLVRPYTPSTIDNWVALRVPSDTGVALMLYDGKTGKVADKRVFIIQYVPLPRSWLMLGDHRAIFLDEG